MQTRVQTHAPLGAPRFATEVGASALSLPIRTAQAMSDALIDRLRAAGLTFRVAARL